MGSKIVVIRSKDNIITSLVKDGELIEVQADKDESSKLLGNIYLGKVRNIVKNINAAFVEVENGQNCYLSLSDIGSPVFSNTDHPGKLRVGDELIVQVAKENARYKAPLATADFSLTGKYLVLVHGRKALGISQKIKDEEQRKRLKRIITPFLSDNYGFIVRTNAADASDITLEQEIGRLLNDYKNIVQFGVHWNCFSRLYSAPPTYLWEIRDGYANEIEEIITDDEAIYNSIKKFVQTYQPEDRDKLKLYTDPQLPLKSLYAIEERIDKALNERVWLDSGAYLIIQPTEALTVIDVNTGRAIRGKQEQEDTFFSVNLEASQEIAKQIRLRNLSGIIIIDFIDMKSEQHQKSLLKTLAKLIESDRIPTQLVDMTSLNLVEITRKKIRKPLAEQLMG